MSDYVSFPEEIFNGKLCFLFSENVQKVKNSKHSKLIHSKQTCRDKAFHLKADININIFNQFTVLIVTFLIVCKYMQY